MGGVVIMQTIQEFYDTYKTSTKEDVATELMHAYIGMLERHDICVSLEHANAIYEEFQDAEDTRNNVL